MDIVDKIYHTLIHAQIEGDTFFHVPENWVVKSEKSYLSDSNNQYDYTFRTLIKNKDLYHSQGLNSLF
jgi:hypothetical protein